MKADYLNDIREFRRERQELFNRMNTRADQFTQQIKETQYLFIGVCVLFAAWVFVLAFL